MNIVSAKAKIIKELNETRDEHLIKAIQEMLLFARISKAEQALKPFTPSELIARAKKSEDDIKKGRVTEINQLRKKIKEW